jgi:hypothetical protein
MFGNYPEQGTGASKIKKGSALKRKECCAV